jgi:hypothetical protein
MPEDFDQELDQLHEALRRDANMASFLIAHLEQTICHSAQKPD